MGRLVLHSSAHLGRRGAPRQHVMRPLFVPIGALGALAVCPLPLSRNVFDAPSFLDGTMGGCYNDLTSSYSFTPALVAPTPAHVRSSVRRVP